MSIEPLYSHYYLIASSTRKITSIAQIRKQRNSTSALTYYLQGQNLGLIILIRYSIFIIRSTIIQVIQKALLGLSRRYLSFLSLIGLQYRTIGYLCTAALFYPRVQIAGVLYRVSGLVTLLYSSYITRLPLGFLARIISTNYIGAFRKGLRFTYTIPLIRLTSNQYLIDYSIEVLVGFYS